MASGNENRQIASTSVCTNSKENKKRKESEAQPAAATTAIRMNNVSYGSKRVFILLKNSQYIVIYSPTLEYNTTRAGPQKK